MGRQAAKLFCQAPPAFAVLALLILLGALLSREASTTEALPAFLPLDQGVVYVELIGDGLVSGVYQFNDGLTPRDVIKLTDPLLADNLAIDSDWLQPMRSGESFRFLVKKGQKITLLQRSWMSASHRMALTIPLHPDRMSRRDWKALPGIGDSLAERIENNRQKNGDFGCLEALTRVKGIGEKRINRWKEFFGEA
jgi:competence protein ComEA